MKTIEQMLILLARADVSEFAIATGRLPCVRVGGSYQPVDDVAPTSAQILQMLVAVGGSRYVDALSTNPTQWTTRVEGVGAIAIAAVMREDKVQARFVVSRRESSIEAAERASTRPPGASPQAIATKTPSIAKPAPAVAPSKAPSVGSRRAPRDNDEPTLDRPAPSVRRSSPATRSPFGELELETTPRLAAPGGRAAPSRGASPSPIAEVEPEAEAATRPGTATMSIELDLERAVAAATIMPGTAQLQSTARDLVLDGQAGGTVSSALDEMLAAARAANASDLHVIAERPLLFRIAGELVPRGAPLSSATVRDAVLARVPARCRVTLERDGSCDFALVNEAHGRFRVNVTRQRTGLKACVRLVPSAIPTLASLGLPAEIANATHHHQGLIVVTGPTGHGKTTTLAAIVDILNSGTTHHIITVEDPIELVHPRKRAMMSQREVGTHTLSFQNALKASLREDPDVIVVGELRDTETVRMALAASETGHLVIGTMNTPSAAKTIDRLIDLFPPADQSQVRMTLAGGLRLIVSQRLVPNVDATGMVAAAELLPGSVALWSLIRDSKTFQIPSLQQRGKGLGIVRLDDSLAELVRAGKTTPDTALAFAENPDDLGTALAGKRATAGVAAPDAPMRPDERVLLQKAGALFGKKGG